VSNGTLGVLPARSRSIRHWESQKRHMIREICATY